MELESIIEFITYKASILSILSTRYRFNKEIGKLI